MGLAVLIVGLVAFLGAHSFVSFRVPRAAIVQQLGGTWYFVLFTAVSLAGIVLIGRGFALYRATGWTEVWHPPDYTRHIASLLMWPSIVLVTAAYLPGHIKRWARHPMLAGVKLWALAHLISNGDLGSILLFGAFLVWAGYARIAIRRREAAGEIATSSDEPGWTNDLVAVLLGTFIYFALGYTFHPAIVGVPVFGR
jgi:uncharacterized membrane protein